MDRTQMDRERFVTEQMPPTGIENASPLAALQEVANRTGEEVA